MVEPAQPAVDAPSLEGLLKIFSFEKKRELEQYCRRLVISIEHFADLVLSCEMSGRPFLHKISYRDRQPKHLHLSEEDIKALGDNGVGPLTPAAAKAVRKMGQMFEERRYLVGHIFYVADLSKWHFFCFDQRDLEHRKPNHWREGSHVHFINWLWPGQDARSMWSNFVEGDYRPGDALHVRFQGRR